jgi:hypothetical protein
VKSGVPSTKRMTRIALSESANGDRLPYSSASRRQTANCPQSTSDDPPSELAEQP